MFGERQDRFSFIGSGYEFDLYSIGVVFADNRTEMSAHRPHSGKFRARTTESNSLYSITHFPSRP